MKLILFLIALVALALPALAQPLERPVQSSKAFATTTSRTDTSAVVNTGFRTYVELATSTVGTDSLQLGIHVQYRPNGGTHWLTAVRDTVHFGPATTTTGKSKGTVIRSASTNYIPGSTEVRVLTTFLRQFRTADSTAATKYSQKLLLIP